MKDYSMSIAMTYVHRTTHIPTGKMFHGVHKSSDINFGTEQWQDPYIGNGMKLKELAGRRTDFVVTRLYVGGEKDAWEFFDKIKLQYDHPLCLNLPDTTTPGYPKSEEHKRHISESMLNPFGGVEIGAPVGNDNAVGQVKPKGKMKWFNDGTTQAILEHDENRVPVNPKYKDWKLGQLPKKQRIAQ